MLVWVLGGGGLLGREMQRCLQKKDIAFFATTHAEADIRELEALKKIVKKKKPTHIVNCSAYNKVDEAEKEEKLAFEVNAKGAENLGILALLFQLRIIHISTDYVFDGKKESPYLESDLCHPLNVYGRSKLEGERRLFHQFPESCVVRTSWLFGKGGINFISHLPQLFQTHEELSVDAEQISRPTYCPDLAEMLIQLLSKTGLFHFANGKMSSRFEVASLMLDLCHRLNISVKCRKVKPLKERAFKAPRPHYSVLGSEKISLEGMRPWEQILTEFLLNA